MISGSMEHVSLPYGARLQNIQSTAPYLTEHASIYLRSTAPEGAEQYSRWCGALLYRLITDIE